MNRYNRILVLGSPGAGKTYFSNRLSEKLQIKVIHLDDYYWKSNWIACADKEWNEILEQLLEEQSYIMEGNYVESLEKRIKYVDLIIYIDTSLLESLKGYTRRMLKNYLIHGSELPKEIMKEKKYRLSEKGYLNFCGYIISYHRRQKRELLNYLKNMKNMEVLFITKQDFRGIENEVANIFFR